MLGLMNQAALRDTSPGAWWGYAEADSTLAGVLVAAVAALAVIYVVMRWVRGRGARSGSKAGARR
jgi:hypothetical protein